jgi:hypothetical protein
MTSLIDVRHERAGMTELRICTDHVALNVIPAAGGKILDLIELGSGFNLLWQNPRIPLARTYAGAPFDDVWCGGWDDMFPTDVPCEVEGNTHHDHGDLWIGPWDWEVVSDTSEQAVVRLHRDSPSLPCRVDKWITVDRSSPSIRIRLALTNEGAHPVRFLWNQHIAHAIGPGSRVHLPVSRLAVAGPTRSRAGDATSVSWPVHGGTLDLSRLPGPEAGVTEFLCADDLQAGWCAVTHPKHGVAVRLDFDPAVFRTPWLWGVFGGWRGHQLLLTELCTSRPGSLATAVADGSAATLASGATLETDVVMTVSGEFDADAPGDEDPLGER